MQMESPSQTIKIEQSQSDRSKVPYHPVRYLYRSVLLLNKTFYYCQQQSIAVAAIKIALGPEFAVYWEQFVCYPRRLCRSAWVERSSVCPHHNSKTNDPKVFKLGLRNDLVIYSKWYAFGLKDQKSVSQGQ